MTLVKLAIWKRMPATALGTLLLAMASTNANAILGGPCYFCVYSGASAICIAVPFTEVKTLADIAVAPGFFTECNNGRCGMWPGYVCAMIAANSNSIENNIEIKDERLANCARMHHVTTTHT